MSVRLIIMIALQALAAATRAEAQGPSPSQGPDVFVGFVNATVAFGSHDIGSTRYWGVSTATNSCNHGTENLKWYEYTDPRHPVIAVNLYRLSNDRIEQLGQSWVKHGFLATNRTACLGIPSFPHRACRAASHEHELGPGCSDLYGAGLNADPRNLGPRSKIQPATGEFINPQTGAPDPNAKDLTGYPTVQSELQKIVFVSEADLMVSNAKFFVEAHYIAADDARANNARNNTTYREVVPRADGGIEFQLVGTEVRGEPAIKAWPNASFSEKTEAEGSNGERGTVIVASKAVPVSGSLHRYEYAVYNMNSDLGIQSFRVPSSKVVASSVGFRAVQSYGELSSNEPWTSAVAAGSVGWVVPNSQSPTANAIRWGTTYNFWFVADSAPSNKSAVVSRFKARAGATSPESFQIDVVGPVE